MRLFLSALLAAGLVDCKQADGGTTSYSAANYAGSAGRSLVFELADAHVDTGDDTADTAADTGAGGDTGDTAGDTADTDGVHLTIEIDDANWTLTLASSPTTLPWTVTDGLLVADSALLPPTVTQGASADGVDVTAVGEYAVRYGTFPDTASTTVSTGSLAGEWAFARDVGPIVGHYADQDWELIYYQ